MTFPFRGASHAGKSKKTGLSMSFRHPRTSPNTERSPESTSPTPSDTGTPAAAVRPVLRTRTGMAWVSVCAAALVAVALVIFAVQNTRSVEVSFLWMTAGTPLALALLIGTIGGVLLALVLGTARIAQLRRQVRGPKR